MSTSTPIKSLKTALRRKTRSSLRSIPQSSIKSQSQQLTNQIIKNSHIYRNAKSISIYLSLPAGEIATDGIVKHALENNKSVYIPYCPPSPPSPKGFMKMLRISDPESLNHLPLNKMGIREYDTKMAEEVENALDDQGKNGLDIIFMPGLLFDPSTYDRLGHGGGFYDRFVIQAKEWSTKHGKDQPVTIALSLREQLLPPSSSDKIPTTEWDIKPDEIYSPSDDRDEKEN